MEQRAVRVRDRGDPRGRLHDAGLVVRQHDRDQRRARIGPQHRVERREIDDAVRDPPGCARPRARPAGPNRARPPKRGCARARAEQREMIGLGAAADENHPVRRRADQGRHRLARPLDPLPRGAARSDAPRTDCRSAPAPRHRRNGLGPQRRGRVPVEIGLAPGHRFSTANGRSAPQCGVRGRVFHRAPIHPPGRERRRAAARSWCRAPAARRHRRATPS